MKNENQQLWIILLIVFMGFVGTSISYPLFPSLFLYPVQNSIVPIDWGQNLRSILLGIALASYPLGQFFGAPIFGGYSDRYGRKRMLLLSLSGSVLGYLLTAIALHFNVLWLLLLGRFLTGLMEGNLGIVEGMAADLQSISKYKSFGRIHGAASIGYLAGPMLGGLLADQQLVSWFSYTLPFVLAALLTSITGLLAWTTLVDTKLTVTSCKILLKEQFNIVNRLQSLIKNNPTLKWLLIVSTLFTFSVDIFYEFGPVYLTGLWTMTPAWIAIYNMNLCICLAIGHGWLVPYLSQYFNFRKIITVAIATTTALFLLLTIWPIKLLAFIIFGLVGFSISIATSNLTVQISDVADRTTQGEVMGSQQSLRMLGDACICLVGGFLIISSILTPIILSSFFAYTAVMIYFLYRRRV